jgi:glycosyltransferase involved in cell wall biosynthesis
MNIVQLTPGAGGMYCGACMRDNALTAAFAKLGHQPLLIPLYTPLTTDEPDNSFKRIFFGGINVFLQQKLSVFRKTPAWMDKQLDGPGLLRFATRFGVKTKPEELGDLMISMLKGEEGFQSKELEKLGVWLSENCKPDVIVLSNVLLCGLVRRIKKAFSAPVFCTLQGEDFFLDGLPEPQRSQSWKLLEQRAAEIDGFIAVSRYYGEVMRKRMNIAPEKVHVVHNGIELSGYGPAPQPPATPVIGYLARMSPEKGLRTLVEAFKILRARGKVKEPRLRIAGSQTPNDKAFVDEIIAGLKKDGLMPHVDILPNVGRAEKIAFLQSLSVFSVPAAYGESFGLYVLEALACGVPVIQPDHAAFPELLEAAGGGLLCAPNNAEDLAVKWEALMLDEPRRRELGMAGHQKVMQKFSIERVAKDLAALYEKASGTPAATKDTKNG